MNKIILLLCGSVMLFKAQAQHELYNNGALLYINTDATIHVNGSFTNTGAGVDFQNNGAVTITGNSTNNQVMSSYTGKLIFNNTSAQTLDGTADFLTKDFEINNAAGATLNAKLVVDGVATFTNGILTSSAASTPLWFTANGSYSGASDASHVNGYVVKEGTGGFTYPVGDGSRYQRIEINTTANAGGISVRYAAADAGAAPFAGPIPLLYNNTLEYWDAAPVSTATGIVTIYWDDYNNVGIGNIADLRVAHLAGGSWLNEGAAGVTGTISAGSVTGNAISTWSPFTLGSVSTTSTLPVNWLSVTGSLNTQKQAQINWRVSEYNVSDYQIEKSSNSNSFTNIATLQSKGNGENNYIYTELQALQNTAYYRIKQTDRDGKFTYSSVIKLSALSNGLTVYPTPFKESFTVISPAEQTARLISADGKLIRLIQLKTGNNYINAGNLSKGVYILIAGNTIIKKLIKE